jgi:hypothetical protein
MSQLFKYVTCSTVIAILMTASISLPRIYAQSSVMTHSLPIGKWDAQIKGANGTLIISSVDKMGKIQGTLVGKFGCATEGKSCIIQNGTFNIGNGRISFTTQSSGESFAPIVQNYTGYEYEKMAGIDFKVFQIYGIGKSIEPVLGDGWGWSAAKGCTVMGCIG